MNSKAIIEYQDAEKFYDSTDGTKVHALKKLNLSIYEGESFALLGPNGAGKTTAINLLAGVIPLSEGDINVCGVSVKKHSVQTKKFLGVVQQELIVDSFFNLPTILNIQSKLSGVMPDKEWIDFLLDKLMLTTHAKKTTRELSGGMKRRMMIARALVHKPKILVLDEPTAGVDIHLRHSMWEFIRALHKFGITIILTTHYLEEAENFCRRIAIMNHGELATLKTNKDLLEIGGKPRFVVEFKPHSVFSSLNDLSQEFLATCQNKGILCEMNTEDHHTKLILKQAFDNQELGALQNSLQELQSVLSELPGGSILNMYTEQTKLEDVFIELTK